MEALRPSYDADRLENEDSNENENQDIDDHILSPAVRLSGARSPQAGGSTLPTSPVLRIQSVSVSPIITLPTVNLAVVNSTVASNITGGNTAPVGSQRRRNKEKSIALGASFSRGRQNSAEPPAKIAKTENRTGVSCPSDYDDDGQTCSICFDRWSSTGKHRLVALKCGHVFGHSCVKKWLQSKPLKNRKCPSCNANANIRDLRFLYARRLVSDSSEIEALKQELETMKDEKNRIELELRQVQMRLRLVVQEPKAYSNSS